jgi:ankyrin repeat protein
MVSAWEGSVFKRWGFTVLLLAIHACVGLVGARAGEPLVTAIQSYDYDAFDDLVANRVGIDWRDAQTMTPLMHAVLSNEVSFVETLIRAGAEVNAKTRFGYSPLHYAAFTSEAVVRSLVYWRAELESQDEGGNTPLLLLAADPGSDPAMLRLLLGLGADIAAVNADGATALILAARHNPNAEVLGVLCGAGGEVLNATDALGNTALSYVMGGLSEEGELQRVVTNQRGIHTLLDCGADVNSEVNGRLPLELAEANMHLRGSASYWRINDLTDRPTELVGLGPQGGTGAISPRPVRLLVGEQESFTFQIGEAPVASVRWQAALGQIDASGLYLATAPGRESITATNRKNEQETFTLIFVVEDP